MAATSFSLAGLSGAVVVPTSSAIFKGPGRLTMNSVDGYRRRPALAVGAICPRWLFADCDGSIETQGPSTGVAQSMASTSEAGIVGPDSQVRFAKVADPQDAARSAFVMVRKNTDEGVLLRTELSLSPTFAPVPLGAACWLGFAFRLPSAWKAAAADDETMLWQIHESPDGGDDTQPAPIGWVVQGARSRMWVRSNPNAVTLVGATNNVEVFSESQWPADEWQYFAVRLRSHWDAAQQPRVEVWRRVAGTTVKLVDYGGPNTYNNTARDYVKTGLYYYDNQWSGGLTSRTMHHKGVYQLADGPGMSQASVFELLDSV